MSKRADAIDLDAITKEMITALFKHFIQLANPALYAAVDWSYPPVSLEQELINILKGKYKIKGKRKNSDKLVRLRLLDGSDHFVLVHIEFQHRPEEHFERRMYIYFTLGSLRYDTEKITAIAFFTGAPPDSSQLEYKTNVFGTKLSYEFISYIAAAQNEADLIDSDNPVALGVLAMLYAWKSEGKPQKRLQYKKKLFDLVLKKGIEREDFLKALIFVRDFIHLSPKLENEFQRDALEPFILEKEDMYITQGTKDMFEIFYQRAHGFSPKAEIAKIKREAKKEREAAAREFAAREVAAQEAAARESAAREAAAREAAAREAAAAAREAAAREAAIFKLFKEFEMPVENIAKLYDFEVAYIYEVIEKHTKKETPDTDG